MNLTVESAAATMGATIAPISSLQAVVSARVIGTGDELLGRTVTGLVFGREGYNDAGQLTFIATFYDGSSTPFLATPIVANRR